MSTMSTRNLLTGLIVVAVALGGEVAWAQKSAQTAWDLKPTTATSRTSRLTEPVLERIQNIEAKMVAAAEDFPEAYNTYRPKGNEDVRTACGCPDSALRKGDCNEKIVHGRSGSVRSRSRQGSDNGRRRSV